MKKMQIILYELRCGEKGLVIDMLKIEIKTGGAAFCDPATGEESEYWESVELNRILATVCLKIEEGETSGSCMDINGNKVGKWSR